MKANCKNHKLVCNERYTDAEQKRYKYEVGLLYELGIDIYQYDGQLSRNINYIDNIHNSRNDEQQAVNIVLRQHKDIPDDLRTRLMYYKNIHEQMENTDEQLKDSE